MINKQTRIIDNINITFDKNFIRSLTLLSKRRIDPIIINVENEDVIVGIKCPVVMNEDTFEEDKKAIESDILKAFADILNSEICNREREKTIFSQASQKLIKIGKFPCPLCGSISTIGYGKRITKVGLKERRFCNDCQKGYTNQNGIDWKMKNRRDVIEEAVKLSENNSLRDTARLIKEKFNVEISYSAIHYWRKNRNKSKDINLAGGNWQPRDDCSINPQTIYPK